MMLARSGHVDSHSVALPTLSDLSEWVPEGKGSVAAAHRTAAEPCRRSPDAVPKETSRDPLRSGLLPFRRSVEQGHGAASGGAGGDHSGTGADSVRVFALGAQAEAGGRDGAEQDAKAVASNGPDSATGGSQVAEARRRRTPSGDAAAGEAEGVGAGCCSGRSRRSGEGVEWAGGGVGSPQL
ncbi:glycine-rich protein 1-like [Eucalyptus grandis]|uniref:glycine-rich protein 1-like n=1 Tax=Eucalyptus grandis TaxID=71139 RepID=UPI00192EFE68|nr:glycine-rich protein 1-like [Eucalyptus grandis]